MYKYLSIKLLNIRVSIFIKSYSSTNLTMYRNLLGIKKRRNSNLRVHVQYDIQIFGYYTEEEYFNIYFRMVFRYPIFDLITIAIIKKKQ